MGDDLLSPSGAIGAFSRGDGRIRLAPAGPIHLTKAAPGGTISVGGRIRVTKDFLKRTQTPGSALLVTPGLGRQHHWALSLPRGRGETLQPGPCHGPGSRFNSCRPRQWVGGEIGITLALHAEVPGSSPGLSTTFWHSMSAFCLHTGSKSAGFGGHRLSAGHGAVNPEKAVQVRRVPPEIA